MNAVRSVLMIIFFTACGTVKTVPQSEINVFGGRPSTNGEWSSAIAMLTGGKTFCSGTIVHPRLVTTAAHCVTRLQTESISPIKVLVGENERTGKTYTIDRIKYYTGYRDTAETDIAYLRMAEPVTGVEILPILSDKQEIDTLLRVGARSMLVGFGTTESGQIGTKHSVETTIGPSEAGALFIGGNGKDTCQGDSGGPAYGQLPNGEWRAYGITSRGGKCSGGGTYARIHDQICWIQEDSGIVIPGVKTDCPRVEKISARSPKEIFLAIGNSGETSGLTVGSGAEIKKVAICKASVARCRTTRSQDLTFNLDETKGDTSFFTTQATVADIQSEPFTLLGFDEFGNLRAANPMRLKKR